MARSLKRLALIALICGPGVSAGQSLVVGQDYSLVTPALPTNEPSRIVVTEFFSYECPHCYAFFPVLTSWASKLPSDVKFERVAVSVGHSLWMKPAQLYYALVAANALDRLDPDVFRAIHERHVDLTSDAAVIDWVSRQGLDRDQFTSVFNSFGVRSAQARGDQQAKAVRLPSVPTLVIDGKYLLRISDSGAFPPQLAVADRLIAQARAEKAH